MNSSYSHSFRVLRFYIFFHDDTSGLDSVQTLFAVCLPGSVVRVIGEGDGPKWMLEDLLVRRFGRGHDVLMWDGFFLISGRVIRVGEEATGVTECPFLSVAFRFFLCVRLRIRAH